jgi:hypothetical protein
MNEFQSYNCEADRLVSAESMYNNPLKVKYFIDHPTREGRVPLIR